MASFSDQIRQFNVDFTRLSEDVFRGTVIKFFGDIVKESPFDTGRFRGNWFVTTSVPSTSSTTSIRSTSQVNQEIIQTVGQASYTSNIFWLTNNLPYAETLEFGGYNDGPKTIGGFSKKAPQGMVRITADRFTSLLAQNASVLNSL